MKMTGEEVITAPRQAVWDALNDPEILKQAITGCQEIKKKSDTEFEAKVVAKVGPVKASFVGNVKLSKLNPPRSYVISGEGKGGVAGFAKGGATVRLSDTGDSATKLSYDVDAQVGGKLAQIGSRLIDSTAKKMAADFFKKFNKIVSQGSEDTDMTKKPTAKKAAAKKPAAKKPAAKAAKPAAAKAAAKTAAAKPAAKTTSKPAAKAVKTAAKAAAKTKTAAKSAASSASKTASAARKSAASTASAASAAAGEAVSSSVNVAKETASEVTSAAKSTASSASQTAEKAKDTASDNIPPQVKSMSGLWTWVMLAAAAGLVLLWATGK